MYYVYLLCDEHGKFYVGYSHDLRRRIREHALMDVYTTKRMKNPKLVYYEAYATQYAAIEREKKLKQHGSSWQGLRKRLRQNFTEAW